MKIHLAHTVVPLVKNWCYLSEEAGGGAKKGVQCFSQKCTTFSILAVHADLTCHGGKA